MQTTRPLYSDQSLSAQTAYAQLLEAALGAEHVRGISDLQGSFNAKTVKGRKYWYFQFTEPSGKLHQLYVGPCERRSGTALFRLSERGFGLRVLMTPVTALDGRPPGGRPGGGGCPLGGVSSVLC